MAPTVPAVSRSQMLPAPMSEMIRGLMPDIRNLLPADLEYEQFRAALWLELTGNRQLKECTVESIRAGAIKCATYGLLPGKFAHLLPFKNKGRLEATFVPNYFGVLLTLERSGKVAKAFAHPVYEGDDFTIDYFADDYHHIPYSVRERPPGEIKFYYGAVKMKDGTIHVEVLSLEQIEAVRKRAPAHDSGPWVTDRIAMSRKTALKAVAKYVHLTPEGKQMLEEEAEREQTDISPERHHQNIVDLFGDGNGGYSHQPAADGIWLDTIKAHWQDVPEPLRGQCKAVLDGEHQVSESEGFALASAVMDAIDALPQAEGGT
jgi:recombination protein RecT